MQAGRPLRRRILAAAGGGAFVLGVAVPQVGVAGASPPAQGQENGSEVEPPADYASAAFDAWVDGDEDELRQRVQPSVAEFLLARGPGNVDPRPVPLCEGAAGSTYCTWLLAEDDIQLLLRVDNQAASEGQPGAVVEAAFITSPGGVAIWPLTTQEEADNTQQSVDEGHSPWMLDPPTVITFYAEAELGWAEDTVDVAEGDHETPFLLTNTSTGLVVDVEVTRPARPGDGGIWAMARAGVSEPFDLEPDDGDHGHDGDHGGDDTLPSVGSPGSPSPAPPAPPVTARAGFTG